MPKLTFAQAVERLKELSEQEGQTAWEMGDIALAMVPMGADHAHNGADEKVRVLAEAAGIDPTVLRQRRQVASTFPQGTRVPSVSWSVYRELLNVEPTERERLLQMIRTEKPGTVSGRWTVSAVRVQMGMPAILHVSEPVSEHVQRASTEERAAIFTSLRDEPAVLDVVEAQDTAEEVDFDTRQERLEQESPIHRATDKGLALMRLNKAVWDFVRDAATALQQIERLPTPE